MTSSRSIAIASAQRMFRACSYCSEVFRVADPRVVRIRLESVPGPDGFSGVGPYAGVVVLPLKMIDWPVPLSVCTV